jgi:hypothetical protein
MQLQPGTRLRSAVDATEVVVVRAPAATVEISCGGHPMHDIDAPGPSAEPDPAWTDGTLLGKRYGSEELGLEVLCTKPGAGSLSVDGKALESARAKPLPASD